MTAFVGRNGQGKTNLVEAVDYLSRLRSHRVATDAPLVRAGATQAVVRAAVVKEGRTAVLEVELNPGRANRARVNRSPLPRAARPHRAGAHGGVLPRGPHPGQGRPVRPAPLPRRPAGAAHPAAGRAHAPTTTGCSSSATRCSRPPASPPRRRPARARWPRSTSGTTTWPGIGAELLAARLQLVDDLRPHVGKAYADRGPRGEPRRRRARLPLARAAPDGAALPTLSEALLAGRWPSGRREDELDRGISLVGPHRDELLLTLGLGAGERRAPRAAGSR